MEIPIFLPTYRQPGQRLRRRHRPARRLCIALGRGRQ